MVEVRLVRQRTNVEQPSDISSWPKDGAKLVLSWARLGEVGDKLGPSWANLASFWPRRANIETRRPKDGQHGSHKPSQNLFNLVQKSIRNWAKMLINLWLDF